MAVEKQLLIGCFCGVHLNISSFPVEGSKLLLDDLVLVFLLVEFLRHFFDKPIVFLELTHNHVFIVTIFEQLGNLSKARENFR